jgi:hypothetical protein
MKAETNMIMKRWSMEDYSDVGICKECDQRIEQSGLKTVYAFLVQCDNFEMWKREQKGEK